MTGLQRSEQLPSQVRLERPEGRPFCVSLLLLLCYECFGALFTAQSDECHQVKHPVELPIATHIHAPTRVFSTAPFNRGSAAVAREMMGVLKPLDVTNLGENGTGQHHADSP